MTVVKFQSKVFRKQGLVMILRDHDDVENPGTRTVPHWQRYSRYGLRSLLLAVSACCVVTWIAPHVLERVFSPEPLPIFLLPTVAPVAQWKGEIPIEDVNAARRAGRIIVDDKTWTRSCAILGPNDPRLDIDFTKNFAIVSVGKDPNRLDVGLHIDERCNLHVWETHTLMAFRHPTEASVVVTVVARKGIKSVRVRQSRSESRLGSTGSKWKWESYRFDAD